jgi:glycosyltransferase involved in cell wall biosynthesis
VRVTFVLPCLPWGPIGGFRTAYEYANHLVAHGHEVTVLHPREVPGTGAGGGAGGGAPARRPLRDGPRRLAGLLKTRYGRPSLWWQTVDPRVELRYVRRLAPVYVPDGDAVVATAWITASFVHGLAPSKGRKLYLVQDFYPYLGGRAELERSWRLPLVKVSISSWLADLVRLAGSDATAIPIAVDHARFQARTPPDARGETVALMCGGAPYKALDVAFEALHSLRARRPGVRVRAFGTIPRPGGLPEWAEYHRNIAPDGLAALYDASAVFLCSSAAEGFALPPAEALACGSAVATTDCGGNREYADHGVTALVSAPGDARALADHAGTLLADTALRVRLVEAGMTRVRALTWDRAAARFEQVIAESVGVTSTLRGAAGR